MSSSQRGASWSNCPRWESYIAGSQISSEGIKQQALVLRVEWSFKWVDIDNSLTRSELMPLPSSRAVGVSPSTGSPGVTTGECD